MLVADRSPLENHHAAASFEVMFAGEDLFPAPVRNRVPLPLMLSIQSIQAPAFMTLDRVRSQGLMLPCLAAELLA